MLDLQELKRHEKNKHRNQYQQHFSAAPLASWSMSLPAATVICTSAFRIRKMIFDKDIIIAEVLPGEIYL